MSKEMLVVFWYSTFCAVCKIVLSNVENWVFFQVYVILFIVKVLPLHLFKTDDYGFQ